MDRNTQQNAAMVEESSASTKTLAAETQKLRSMFEHFVLSRTSQKKYQELLASGLKPRRAA